MSWLERVLFAFWVWGMWIALMWALDFVEAVSLLGGSYAVR